MAGMTPELRQLVAELEQAQDDDAVYAALDRAHEHLPGFTAIGPTLFRYRDFELMPMLKLYSRDYVANLSAIQPLALKCAPVLIQHIDIDEYHSLIITTYPGNTNHQWLPYAATGNQVSIEAKQQFLAEMEKLLRAGYRHNYVTRNTNHWFLNSGTGDIILDNWESLTRLNGKQTQVEEELDALRRLLEMTPNS